MPQAYRLSRRFRLLLLLLRIMWYCLTERPGADTFAAYLVLDTRLAVRVDLFDALKYHASQAVLFAFVFRNFYCLVESVSFLRPICGKVGPEGLLF